MLITTEKDGKDLSFAMCKYFLRMKAQHIRYIEVNVAIHPKQSSKQ